MQKSKIRYRGDIEITIKDRNGNKVCKYHNKGTKFMFKVICGLLQGNVTVQTTDAKISALNAVSIISSNNNDVISGLLYNLPQVYSQGISSDGTESSGGSCSVTFNASISYSDINQSALSSAIDNSGTIKLLLLPYSSVSSESNKDDPSFAFAEMIVDPEMFSLIQPGVQSIIEWTLTFSNEGE